MGKISGTAFGGRQPIVGAEIFVFAASTGGYGGSGITASTSNASFSLLTAQTGTTQDKAVGSITLNDYYATTSATGNFSLTGDYTCTQGTQVYLYSKGGNSGAGVNSAVTLMALLGTCPSTGTMAALVPFVNMNELTTVAAAYSAAGFATDPLHIGSTGSTLAQTGLANAFANSAQMVAIGGGGGPAGGGSALANTPGTGTNGGTGVVPQSELNTLADILAACVNSVGASSPACSALFGYATSDGTTGGTAPTDTATAAVNIAHHPAANVTGLFNIQPASGQPYLPALSAAPSDWSVNLSFADAFLAQTSTGGSTSPRAIAVDASGNIWYANPYQGNGTNTYGTYGLHKFSPLGVPGNSTGYNLGGYYFTQVAVDASSSNVWLSAHGNAVTSFNIAAGTHTIYSEPSISVNGTATYPVFTDLEFDGSGNLWGSDKNIPSLYEINPSNGAVVATTQGNNLATSWSVAIEPGAAGNVWVANTGNGYASLFTNADVAVTSFTNTKLYPGSGSAIDAGGNFWVASAYCGCYTKIAAGGGSGTTYAFGGGEDDVAIDGGNNVWGSDRNLGTIYGFTNTGTALTGANGLKVPYTGSTAVQPDSIAIDGSGNVWYSTFNSNTLREDVGAAVPVVTPTAYAVANSTLGTRP
jgi:sugar lactone lactonase YvrE